MSQLTNKKIKDWTRDLKYGLALHELEETEDDTMLITFIKDLLSQTISDTRREERKRVVKLFMSYPFEMLDFHDGDMKKAVFVKKKDLLDFLSKLQKKGEE